MSEQDVKPVSAQTGQFAVVKLAPDKLVQAGNAQSESGKKVPEIEKADMEILASEMNVVSRSIGRDLRFQVDMESGRSVIQVLDRETGEIIRQIPPESAESYVSDHGEVVLRLYNGRV